MRANQGTELKPLKQIHTQVEPEDKKRHFIWAKQQSCRNKQFQTLLPLKNPIFPNVNKPDTITQQKS
jgi:hypothetical protein